jgi:hypothetical protein
MGFLDNLWMQSIRVLWAILFLGIIAPVFVVVWGTVAVIMAALDVIGELFGMSIVEKGDLLMQPYEWFVAHINFILAGGRPPKALPYL